MNNITSMKAHREREAMRAMIGYAAELDAILAGTVLPAMRNVNHPLAGRLHSLRQEIRLQAMVVGGAL
ncbi:hypothetical protein [Stutzerimonas xanthomarina]|uniref:hypothetical protein n=1 Tax=Stutzerimonas xanthomarina TaxID=271420 RepID=UPI0029AAA2BC|nr:hypothetical protein [Stutzerimonas xanthomarina]MDX2352492.1 hypothetical protein [Stutzerimonas xanthomarina]